MDGKYRDLIKLINLQRDKLNNQQVEMTKVCWIFSYIFRFLHTYVTAWWNTFTRAQLQDSDVLAVRCDDENIVNKDFIHCSVCSLQYEAEIAYLEGRSREDESRLAHVSSEIERHEKLAQQIDEEVMCLSVCVCILRNH